MPVRIVSVNDLPLFNRRGEATVHRVTTWTVDDLGPFVLDLPIEEWSPERVRSELEAQALQLRLLAAGY